MSMASRISFTRWLLRDLLAAAILFLATAAFVLWQDSRVAILWDLSYLLDSSWRMAIGQLPYSDFPFVHPPLTFLVQAVIMKLTGHVYFHHVLYAAAAGGLATILTWRLILSVPLPGSPRLLALLLSGPLTVLGIYSIFPHPFYDCDCILAVLIALLLFQHAASSVHPAGVLRGILAGIALVVPLFFKQNIGLPFLISTLAAIVLLLAARWLQSAPAIPTPATLLSIFAGAILALLAALLLLHFTVGLGSYLTWTIHFAAQRRLPGLGAMLSVFAEPALLWQLPCIAMGLLLLTRVRAAWARSLSFALLGSPFLWTLLLLALKTDADDRADDLLALWPLLLVLAAALAVSSLADALKRRTLTLRTLLPFILLATIFGTMLSQQLWGSTYAIWPLLLLLVADQLALVASLDTAPDAAKRLPLVPALTYLIAATLLVCGSLYAASDERLSYAQLQDGPPEHSTAPALRGMATRGPWLPEFDQLLRFTATNIPREDGILLLPGEDPFYFATGRTPQFPVLLFDNTTDPYSSKQIAALVHSYNIRWLIVKRELQLKADPMPQRDGTLQELAPLFTLYQRLDNYDVYRR